MDLTRLAKTLAFRLSRSWLHPMLLFLRPGSVAKYCDEYEYVCFCICLSVCVCPLAWSAKPCGQNSPNFLRMLPVAAVQSSSDSTTAKIPAIFCSAMKTGRIDLSCALRATSIINTSRSLLLSKIGWNLGCYACRDNIWAMMFVWR